MLKSEIINYLKSFNTKEMKEFGEYIRSPYFNKNKNVIKLFSILKNHYPYFNSGSFVKENIFSEIYPGKAYNDSSMKSLIFILTKLADGYITQLSINEKPIDTMLVKTDFLRERGMLKSAEKTLEKISKTEKEGIDISYFAWRSEIEHLKSMMLLINDKHTKTTKHGLLRLENFIAYFFSRLVFFYGEIIIGKDSYNNDINSAYINNVISSIDVKRILLFLKKNRNNTLIYKATETYLQLLICYIESDKDSEFDEAKKLLERNIEIFSKNRRIHLLQTLLIISNVRMNGSRYEKYLNESYSICKFKVQNGYYSRGSGKMDVLFYRMVLKFGIELKDIKWIESFTEKYADFNGEQIKHQVYHYSRAFIEAEMGNYESSLKHINGALINIIIFKYDLKLLLLRNYYSLNYIEEAFSQIDALKHFFARDEGISPRIKLSYLEFVKLYTLLLKLKVNPNINKKELLMKKIMKNNDSAFKEWLIEKAKEI